MKLIICFLLVCIFLLKQHEAKSIFLRKRAENENKINNANDSSSSSSSLITLTEFKNALNVNGYSFSADIIEQKYSNLIREAQPSGNIESKRELAMFLSQILWESDGLRARREYACANGCPKEYKSDLDYPGQSYYGRGYIQLTWAYNYIAASKDLYNDDRLLKDPDMVARDDRIAWSTAFWFWKKNVKKLEGISKGLFGYSTLMINGELECGNGPNVRKARKRFEIYKNILKAFNVNEEPKESGCYN